ncbi:ADP-ribosylation factor-like protein 13B isoform X3 [Frankliniella occidentalis]|uniref:ADP-ribosylation factor-like protein 13B isoform X3 n=1 Tax=Frankliniella occidentalis TaxID=133901 RepID=A0A9C6U5E7_FRAOC|nr:ADP-ribosylation factor-like protein 13B isoform X3 [Frankliniella occidentalis]
MGNCCYKVTLSRDRLTLRRRKIVLLLVGLDNAGKTAAAKGLLKENTHPTVPTVGFSSYTLLHRRYSIVIYDLGGGPQIRDIWSEYYADVHGIIYVIDASDSGRINESSTVLTQLLRNEMLKGKPLLLLANKQDVDGALDEIDVVERLNLETIVNELKCQTLVETCCAVPPPSNSRLRKAYTDPGIQNGFRWIINQIIKDFSAINSRVEKDTKAAQVQLLVEKENRRKRVEEQRREREEREGTIIIPLRDGSPESLKSRIITVQPPGILDTQQLSSEEKANPSDSQDSGFTIQTGDRDSDSLSTVISKDSAVQSIHNVKADDGSEKSTRNSFELKPKRKPFTKRSNKTAPANFPTEQQSMETRPGAPHRLPPLTPQPNHVKMFEVKSKRQRFVTSMSLSFDRSLSDLTDEERSQNLVSFPSDWQLLRHQKGKEQRLDESNESNETDTLGKTFVVSRGVSSIAGSDNH